MTPDQVENLEVALGLLSASQSSSSSLADGGGAGGGWGSSGMNGGQQQQQQQAPPPLAPPLASSSHKSVRAPMRAFLKQAVVGFSSRSGEEAMSAILNLPANETTLAYTNKNKEARRQKYLQRRAASASASGGGEGGMMDGSGKGEGGADGGSDSNKLDYGLVLDLFS